MSTRRINSQRRQRLRRQLAIRDGARCFYCGHPFADLAGATLDHLIPYSIWPTWTAAALVLACDPCNQAKGDRLPQQLIRPHHLNPGLVPAAPPTLTAALRGVARALAHALTGYGNRRRAYPNSKVRTLPRALRTGTAS